MLDKDCGYLLTEVLVSEQREALVNVCTIGYDSAGRLAWCAAVIHGQLSQANKTGETLRFKGTQNGAEPGHAVEQMAKQNPNRPSAGDRRRPIQRICRQQTDQVLAAFNLFVNLGQKRRAELEGIVHSDPKCLTQACP